MSHDTNNTESKSIKSSYGSSILFMLLIAFLFISAVNFVEIMSHEDGGHGEEHTTEHAAPAHHDGGHDAMHADEHHGEDHHDEDHGSHEEHH